MEPASAGVDVTVLLCDFQVVNHFFWFGQIFLLFFAEAGERSFTCASAISAIGAQPEKSNTHTIRAFYFTRRRRAHRTFPLPCHGGCR